MYVNVLDYKNGFWEGCNDFINIYIVEKVFFYIFFYLEGIFMWFFIWVVE